MAFANLNSTTNSELFTTQLQLTDMLKVFSNLRAIQDSRACFTINLIKTIPFPFRKCDTRELTSAVMMDEPKFAQPIPNVTVAGKY